jgi:hypothetical protein
MPILDKNENGQYTDTVSIVFLMDAIYTFTGTVTGKTYVFNGAGAVAQIDVRDKDEILDKKTGRACCGGESYKHVFQLVE